MSLSRHFLEGLITSDEHVTEGVLDEAPRRTVACTIAYKSAHRVPGHSHRRGQLLRPVTGAVRVMADDLVWHVMPGQALWLNPGTPHSIDVVTSAILQFLYITPGHSRLPQPRQGLISLNALLAKLLDEIRAAPFHYDEDGPIGRLASVMYDQVLHASYEHRKVGLPQDLRLAMIHDRLTRDPASRRSLSELAREAGTSPRTVSRLLRSHFNTGFREWRRSIALDLAKTRLKSGERVTAVAMDLGYNSASAFISAFKKMNDLTPKQYAAKFRNG